MSLQAMEDLARQLAIEAADAEVEPYAPACAEECEQWRSFPLPNIGSYRPDDWKLIDVAFADKTGMDFTGPAMSVTGLRKWCAEKTAADETAGFAIIYEGQFQLHVGYFTQDMDREPTEEAAAFPGIDLSGVEIANCENCGSAYDANDAPDYCDRCGYDFRTPIWEEGTWVDMPEPTDGDDWPAAFSGKVSEDFFDGDCWLKVTHPETLEVHDVEPDLVKKTYRPEDDPRQMGLFSVN